MTGSTYYTTDICNVQYMKDSVENICISSLNTYWSLLFCKTDELLFTCIEKSTSIPMEILSNSLYEEFEMDFNKTFLKLVDLLPRLNELIFIHIIESSELILQNDLLIPNLKSVIFFYSSIIHALFPFFSTSFLGNKERDVLNKIFTETKFIINKYLILFKDNNRLSQRICILGDFKCGLLKGILQEISERMSCLPLIQQFEFE
ncbi:hypothetical protein FG386_003225 [Cryptosporidium ryanae]|uniref:uncharacterized protein n=1 Tax=Cryptosporidium ryanae TaxID=515981 RepID=UPI00351A5AC9|nr:hypothetical protein FG386_003225 [Cryptosporidium ryanae]